MIFEHETLLRTFNTIFKVKIQTVQDTMEWASSNKFRTVNIYSDSHIIPMINLFLRNNLLQDAIRTFQNKQGNELWLTWIEGHEGIMCQYVFAYQLIMAAHRIVAALRNVSSTLFLEGVET